MKKVLLLVVTVLMLWFPISQAYGAERGGHHGFGGARVERHEGHGGWNWGERGEHHEGWWPWNFGFGIQDNTPYYVYPPEPYPYNYYYGYPYAPYGPPYYYGAPGGLYFHFGR